MKKLLIFIFGIMFGLINFSYGFEYCGDISAGNSIQYDESSIFDGLVFIDAPENSFFSSDSSCSSSLGLNELNLYYFSQPITVYCCGEDGIDCESDGCSCNFILLNSCNLGGGSCEDKSITIYYNSGNTESILCDGTQAIEIQGLSTITSTNTFTPYYNISYTDEDNQKLIESYSKDILYLENGLFKKTYTGNNDWILSVQGNDSENQFSGYVPVFDVTGSTQPIDTDYNMFNNFTDNSLKVLLSNIPGYIQYVFIIGIILFLLGIVKMFKRRK